MFSRSFFWIASSKEFMMTLKWFGTGGLFFQPNQTAPVIIRFRLMSQTRHIREIVAEVRGDAPGSEPSTAASPALTEPPRESPPPEGSPRSLVKRAAQNPVKVLDFIGRLAQAASTRPTEGLDDILEDLGYAQKKSSDDGGDDDDEGLEDSFNSGSSFSINLTDVAGGSQGTMGSLHFSSTVNAIGKQLQLRSALGSFSNELAHRCWLENQPDVLGSEDGATSDSKNKSGEGSPITTEPDSTAKKRRKSRRDDDPTTRTFLPWRGWAAVIFVDLSGYSKIAAALTRSGGAHALSTAVNSYFEAILSVLVDQYGGDVMTFAGDAVVACWPCTSADKGAPACLLACACALDLQRKCGMSPVAGTELTFRMHIGVTFGEVQSQIFQCRSSETMQPAYHFVSGTPLTQTASVVDAAKVGQICITEAVKKMCRRYVDSTPTENDDSRQPTAAGAAMTGRTDSPLVSPRTPGIETYLLTSIDEDFREAFAVDAAQNGVTNHSQAEAPPSITGPDVAVKRNRWLENNLVPPTIAKKLRQGFKTSHIAEMRFLCVLFIRKALESIDTADWFDEVQQVLDASRCPIVQIIHDDKGTHLIAAVNLYTTERSPASVGILAARRLVARETGCIVGLACGEVFCGITGSTAACRWDITGPPCVVACRLMQHGVITGIPALFDDSIFTHADDMSQLEMLPEKIAIKGHAHPISIYVLADNAVSASSAIVATSWGSLRINIKERSILVDEFLSTNLQRGVALVTGPVGVGKRTMIALALGQAQLNFCVHNATRDLRPLACLSTLLEWYMFHADPELQELGKSGLMAHRQGKNTQTLNLTFQLVSRIIEKGLSFCFVIAYAHFMDPSTLGFIKSVIKTKPTVGNGRFLMLLTAYPLHKALRIADLREELQRALAENVLEQDRRTKRHNRKGSVGGAAASEMNGSIDNSSVTTTTTNGDVGGNAGGGVPPLAINGGRRELQTKVLHVALTYPTSASDFADGVHGITYFHIRPKVADALLEATGGCLALIPDLVKLFRTQFVSAIEDAERRRLSGDATASVNVFDIFCPGTVDGTIHMTAKGYDYVMAEIYWPQVAPVACARFTELYDALPPRLQLLTRVVASISQTTGSANEYHCWKLMERLNPRVTLEVTQSDIAYLVELSIFRRTENDGGEVAFCVPAMQDVVVSLFTPDQDKMLKRLAFKPVHEYYLKEGKAKMEPEFLPVFTSFVARLARAAGSIDVYRELIADSWAATLAVCIDGALPDVRQRMEQRIAEEYRRFPTLCTADLFDNFHVIPMLRQLKSPEERALAKAVLLPRLMERCKEFLAPMALGAIGGELQKLCWGVVNAWLDWTKEEGTEFLPKEHRRGLIVNVDAYMEVIAKFESNVPQLGADDNLISVAGTSTASASQGTTWTLTSDESNASAIASKIIRKGTQSDPALPSGVNLPTNLIEEKAFVNYIQEPTTSAEDGHRKTAAFFAYYDATIDARTKRMVAFATSLASVEVLPCRAQAVSANDSVKRAFMRLVCPPPIPAFAVHQSILDLATAGWASKYYNINLQLIRDLVLKRRMASPVEFKAYLLALKMFGDEIRPPETGKSMISFA